MKTRAIVLPRPGEITLDEVSLKDPGPDDVVIETAFTSISAGTERMLLAGRMPHPMLSFPVVPGYETVGRIVEGGGNVPLDLLGQWVYLGGALCYDGVNSAWGGQAARLFADAKRVVPLGTLDPRLGVLLALGATALHGIDLLGDLSDRRVLVLGQGPVGQFAARLARSAGAWVAVSDRVASRLERSEGDLIVDITTTDVRDVLGGPVDVVIDATGSMEAISGSIGHLKQDGAILLLAYYETLSLPYMPLFLKQARLLTAREWGPNDPARVRDLLASGAVAGAPLLTHRVPADRVADAYATALDDPECLKLVLEWQ